MQGRSRRAAYGEVLVHDLTSSKVAVVKMYDAPGLVTDGASGLQHDEPIFNYRRRHSRTYSNDFFLVGDLGVRAMCILVHFFQLVSPDGIC